MQKEYLVLVNKVDFNLVSGLLNFIVDDIKVFPDISVEKIGIFFRIKEDCEEYFDEYRNILEERNLVEFKSIITDSRKKIKTNDSMVVKAETEFDYQAICNKWLGGLV